jgi:hypothetical protein
LTSSDVCGNDLAVSYAIHSRRVRDEALSLGVRRSALGSCVVLYGPYGYRETLAFLNRRCGRLDTPEGLTCAIDLLDASRAVWLAQLAAFGAGRRAAKAAGTRRPAAAELARFAAMGWPGGPHDGRAVSQSFLRQFGLIQSLPEPVRLRRRIRWRNRRLATPPATSRIEWGYLIVVASGAHVLVCCCGLGFGLYDHLIVGLWWAGSFVVLLAVVAILLGVSDDPRKTDAAWRTGMTAERDALQQRLDRAEQRNSDHTERKRHTGTA